MAKQYIHTEVEGQKIKLSNLEKLLYPSIGITKAEVITYYLTIASYILKYISQRPLTLIRFPNNIEKNKFYAKSKPDWTPQWIQSYKIKHTDESIDYIVAHNKASVVWLANLAALELHPMQMTIDAIENPDHFIFDLDPPDNGDFESVKTIAFNLNNFLKEYGYIPFVKTSGSKGLHICVPIIKKYSHEQMVDSVKSIAKLFVSKYKDTCTLAMNKVKRQGKTLIDIFRNHASHTTVAPYSLRGKKGAPISFPITWEQLHSLKSADEIHINNYHTFLDVNGDAWEDFYLSQKPLHNHKQKPEKINDAVIQKLNTYLEKRNFDLSPEPGLENISGGKNKFCIQLHDASNLHYDLRLEQEGVLLSWAIPKGLPSTKKTKRMAIRTEDHPIKYLDFEGTIPKGQYGAGKMWVITKGDITWIEKSEKKYKFKLHSKQINKSYLLFQTKDNQWLIEMMESFETEQLKKPISPMLAQQSTNVPKGLDYTYEIKWDGIRALIFLENEEVKIFSRSGRNITSRFPELCDPDHWHVESGIFDGEIVCLDDQGKPLFSQVISRMHKEGEAKIAKASKTNPVVCYLFDCIALDGFNIQNEPLVRRQSWLNTTIKNQTAIRISETFDDGYALFQASKDMGLEGIMAKKKSGLYINGQRSNNWIKVKNRTEDTCYIAGYTKGEGDRSQLFGALHLLKEETSGKMTYMGKVGTGFDSKKMSMLLEAFVPYIEERKTFPEKTDDDNNSVWLKPELKCKIQYASLSSNGTYREPVFMQLLKD